MKVLLTISNSAIVPRPSVADAKPEPDVVIGMNCFASEGRVLRWYDNDRPEDIEVEIDNWGRNVETGESREALHQRMLHEHRVTIDGQRDRIADLVARVHQLEADLTDLVCERDELAHHSSRLVELLHDAWWVEAAMHLKELASLTSDEGYTPG